MNKQTNDNNPASKVTDTPPASQQTDTPPANNPQDGAAPVEDVPDVVKQVAAEIDDTPPPKTEPPKGDDQPPATTPTVSDELIEKAVRAGLTLDQAKSIGNSDTLQAIVDKLAPNTEPPSDGSDNHLDDHADETSGTVKLPDLGNPDDWDPDVYKVFQQFSAAIAEQNKLIASLRKGGEAGHQTWFDGQVAGLGDGYRDSLGVGAKNPSTAQIAARKAVEDKFSMLQQGYKAIHADIKDEDVFKEAVQLTVGQGKPVQRHTSAPIARPTRSASTNGSTSHTVPGSGYDPVSSMLADVAADLDREQELEL